MDNQDIPIPLGVVTTKADMSHCPLCGDKWATFEEEGKLGRVFFFCLKDMISIWVRDPLLGKYFATESEPCAVCGEKKMALFFRSDGYIKMKCLKCKCVIESVDEKKHEMIMKIEESQGKRKTFKAPPSTESP